MGVPIFIQMHTVILAWKSNKHLFILTDFPIYNSSETYLRQTTYSYKLLWFLLLNFNKAFNSNTIAIERLGLNLDIGFKRHPVFLNAVLRLSNKVFIKSRKFLVILARDFFGDFPRIFRFQ